jgi:hypothetical protein
MKRRRLLGWSTGAVALAGIVTWTALEGDEVARLSTRAPDGSVRATRVWLADTDGAVWIEAASPERPFYRHLLANPRVVLERAGVARAYRATPVAGRAGHDRIRRLLRAKYGWADLWIGLFQDTSQSVAVRLEPIPGGTETLE